MIGLEEVLARTGVSKSQIYRDMKTGKFPNQAKKPKGSTGAFWLEDDIDEFIESRRPDTSPARKCPRAEGGAAKLGKPQLYDPDAVSGTLPHPKDNTGRRDTTLIRTGMKLQGQDVFCHLPSRRLFVAVGSISDEMLAAMGMAAA